jgi:hypothetical protein
MTLRIKKINHKSKLIEKLSIEPANTYFYSNFMSSQNNFWKELRPDHSRKSLFIKNYLKLGNDKYLFFIIAPYVFSRNHYSEIRKICFCKVYINNNIKKLFIDRVIEDEIIFNGLSYELFIRKNIVEESIKFNYDGETKEIINVNRFEFVI